VVFLLLGLCLPFIQHYSTAQSNAALELNLDEAVNLALDYNLNLRKTRIDLAASGYSEAKIWSEIFPTISANVRTSYDTTLFTDSGPAGNPGFGYSAGIGINLGLNAGIPYAMRNIRLAHQSNILRYEDACNQLSIQVTKKFFSLLAEKNNLLLLEEVLNLAQRHYERNQISFRNGLIRELTLIQSNVAFENARYNLSAANTIYANSIAEFHAMLGIPQNTTINLSGEVNIIRIDADAETLIKEYLPGRPDIARALQEIERLEYSQRQLAMQTRAPNLNLSLDWRSSNFNPFTERLTGSAVLNIPIDPWIAGTSRNQSVRRAGDSVEKAMLDLTITEESAKTQIRSLASFLRNSWDSIEIARLGYAVAQRSYQLTDEAFRNGTVESLVLEDSRNNMANARQRLLQSEFAYFNMILDLSAAVNLDWKHLIQIYGVSSEEI
jgi:outer membrane protein TolC